MNNREVVIVAAVRTAIARAPKGALREMRPDDMAASAIRAALARVPQIEPSQIDDVILGCASPELEQGLDVARIAALRAGLPASVPGLTLNRFCASGLEAIATAAGKIATGQADIIMAGGTESMTRVPFMDEATLRPNAALIATHPDTYSGMGPAVENLARKYGITREASDAFALESHRRAIAAKDAGRFDAEIIPLTVSRDGEPDFAFTTDESPRRDSSPEKLASLKPAFGEDGVITAGNASPRSDGAAAVVMMSLEATRAHGIAPLARFAGYAVAAVPPIDFGIAPAYALPKLLKQTGRTLDEIDLIEFNEAFASQVLAAHSVYPLSFERVNVNGGAVALGHPLGATGARQTATLIYEAQRRGSRWGVVTMCAALGMGAAALFDFSAG